MTSSSRRQFLRVVGSSLFWHPTAASFAAWWAEGPDGPAGVLVEATAFHDRGGWVLDAQFLDQVGGAYLLAHGLGRPVANARAEARFDAPGRYRVWVRTTDWCPGDWESPGRFRVHVGGAALQRTFGTEPGWGWQAGGEVEIASAGALPIELEDLTGFDGRCDAIFFSRGDAPPPNEPVELLRFKDRAAGRPALPVSTGAYDLVIVGGGIAGCAAALAADSRGLRVALVQDRPVLGGNASSEIRVHTLGVHGKGGAILTRLDTKHWQNGSDEAIADERKRHAALADSSVSVFKGHRACGLEREGDRIRCVDAREIDTGLVHRFEAPLFVDCTGDGWVGHHAGADSRYGREARSEFDEGWDRWGDLWSPETPDRKVMGTSVMWNTARADHAVDFPDVPFAAPVAKKHTATRGDWNWEYSDDALHQIDDAEHIRDHMLRAIYGTFANAKKDPRNATLDLVWVAHVAGRRESRRLMGDYVYTMRDAVEARAFPDAVVEEVRDIDVHYQLAEQGAEVDFRSEAIYRKVDRYWIPFRCLYSRNVPNLMMAGRCFSCSHIGLGGPRVQNTTGQMGIAVGHAAALCKERGVTPRDVARDHAAELRARIGYA